MRDEEENMRRKNAARNTRMLRRRKGEWGNDAGFTPYEEML
jgi:hypothetical protein